MPFDLMYKATADTEAIYMVANSHTVPEPTQIEEFKSEDGFGIRHSDIIADDDCKRSERVDSIRKMILNLL